MIQTTFSTPEMETTGSCTTPVHIYPTTNNTVFLGSILLLVKRLTRHNGLLQLMNVLGIPDSNPSQGKHPDSIRGFLKSS